VPAQPIGIGTPLIGPYRLLVRAAEGSSRKGFVWEILPISRDRSPIPIRRSARSYRSMEEAYDHGVVALKTLSRS
jgi:hypothetical protein